MRGDTEQNCLNKIRNTKDIENPKRYFGFSRKDVEEIVESIKNAQPNTNLNNFPDFICNNGFIEHFKVTSSKENRKGSIHIKEETLFKKKVESESELIKKKWEQEPNSIKNRSVHWTLKFPEHTYSYLYESFINNWENHIASLNNYKGNNSISIFMIEYTDSALTMYENVFEDWIDGMSNGDIREPEIVEFYRISRDKNLLKYIYEFRNTIKYVIFVYGKDYEVIKLSNIPYLLKLIPWDYVIAPYLGTTMISSLYKIGSVNIYTEGDIESEQNK